MPVYEEVWYVSYDRLVHEDSFYMNRERCNGYEHALQVEKDLQHKGYRTSLWWTIEEVKIPIDYKPKPKKPWHEHHSVHVLIGLAIVTLATVITASAINHLMSTCYVC